MDVSPVISVNEKTELLNEIIEEIDYDLYKEYIQGIEDYSVLLKILDSFLDKHVRNP